MSEPSLVEILTEEILKIRKQSDEYPSCFDFCNDRYSVSEFYIDNRRYPSGLNIVDSKGVAKFIFQFNTELESIEFTPLFFSYYNIVYRNHVTNKTEVIDIYNPKYYDFIDSKYRGRPNALTEDEEKSITDRGVLFEEQWNSPKDTSVYTYYLRYAADSVSAAVFATVSSLYEALFYQKEQCGGVPTDSTL